MTLIPCFPLFSPVFPLFFPLFSTTPLPQITFTLSFLTTPTIFHCQFHMKFHSHETISPVFLCFSSVSYFQDPFSKPISSSSFFFKVFFFILPINSKQPIINLFSKPIFYSNLSLTFFHSSQKPEKPTLQ